MYNVLTYFNGWRKERFIQPRWGRCIDEAVRKGKRIKLQQGDIPELYSVVGEETATHEDLMRTGQNFFAARYGQPNCSRMNTARYMIYTKKKGKPPLVKSLPPTDKNLLLYILRAHCKALLWKAADKQNAPSLCITEFGWEWLNNVPSPVIASGPLAPPDLMKIASCQCRAAGKACSQPNCSCLTASMSCTTYCQCEGPLISVTIQWQPNMGMGTVQLLMLPKRNTLILTLISLNIRYHVCHKPA